MKFKTANEFCKFIDKCIDNNDVDIIVNESATIFYYEGECKFINKDDKKYVTMYSICLGRHSMDVEDNFIEKAIEVLVVVLKDDLQMTVLSDCADTISLNNMKIVQDKIEELICIFKMGASVCKSPISYT